MLLSNEGGKGTFDLLGIAFGVPPRAAAFDPSEPSVAKPVIVPNLLKIIWCPMAFRCLSVTSECKVAVAQLPNVMPPNSQPTFAERN
jgi:hypothetical protein